jgi:dienelactone hydrolase
MTSSFLRLARLCGLITAFVPGLALAQADGKACAVVVVHGKTAASSLAGVARKLQAACTVRAPDIVWSGRKASDAPPQQLLAKQVKDLRRQGYKRILLLGHGTGANAVMAYGGAPGDAEGVIALGGDLAANPEGWGELPALAGGLKQHVPLLWIVGTADPLFARGEDFAFAKAPPHPASRYVSVKGDAAAVPEAGATTVLEWIRELP